MEYIQGVKIIYIGDNMDENINSFPKNNIDTLQEPTIPSTIFYLGFLFTAGVVAGSILGIVLTKER